jgi:hypothetical protein
MTGAIKVKVEEDRFGNLRLNPVRELYQRKINKHLMEYNINPDHNATALLQQDESCALFLAGLSYRARSNINAGYSAVVLIDAWDFLHFYGWDCHALAETGELWREKDSPEYFKGGEL